MNRGNNQQKGYWFDDDFWSYVKGFNEYEATYRDAMKFSIEIDRVSNNLFEEISNDKRYFDIQYPDSTICKDLSEYFLEYRGHYRDRLYGEHFGLASYFSRIMHGLIIYGESYHAIDWEEKLIEDRTYILPSDISRYLNPSSMTIIKSLGNLKGYRQKYSPLSQVGYDPTIEKVREFNFKPDEVFYTKYPLDNEQPVKKSMSLLKAIQRYWNYTLEDAEASANVSKHKLKLEKARFQSSSVQRRKYALTRAKVRKNFHYLLNTDDLTTTEYYDIYLVVEYKKNLNTIRNYFVQEFNNQVFVPLTKKNKFSEKPVLKLKGFMTDEEIDVYFEDYKSRKISAREFIEKVVKHDTM